MTARSIARPGPLTAQGSPVAHRIAVVGIGALAVVTRLPDLGRPGVLVFDEAFYAPDAADLVRWGSEHGQPVHPPLGKWLIAIGIRIFGFTPVGYRLPSVVAGGLLCALTVHVVDRLIGRLMLAVSAGLLLVVDGLVFVTSRLALLDVFVALFLTLAFAFLVAAWQSQPDRCLARRYGAGAVLAVALGIAVKWSAVPALLPVGVVLAVLDHRLVPPGHPRFRAWALTAALTLGLPLAVYLLAFVPREIGPDRIGPRAFLAEQTRIARFHRDLRPTNRYAVSARSWMAQTAPAALYLVQCKPASSPTSDGVCRATNRRTEGRILATPNPVVWFLGLAGALCLGALAARGDRMAVIILGFGASQWVPWLLTRREAYSFYAVTLVPFLVIAVAYGAQRLPVRARAALALGSVALASAVFVLLLPIWTARAVSPHTATRLTAWPGWP